LFITQCCSSQSYNALIEFLVIGFIGVIISCFELICCSFFASCIFAFIFLFAASGVQMGVFGMFASPGWCSDFDTDECYENHIDSATFWMILLAGFFYFLSSLVRTSFLGRFRCCGALRILNYVLLLILSVSAPLLRSQTRPLPAK
jgi:hypothetical protein